jgi:MYXO-CTERM domain-containing protein
MGMSFREELVGPACDCTVAETVATSWLLAPLLGLLAATATRRVEANKSLEIPRGNPDNCARFRRPRPVFLNPGPGVRFTPGGRDAKGMAPLECESGRRSGAYAWTSRVTTLRPVVGSLYPGTTT